MSENLETETKVIDEPKIELPLTDEQLKEKVSKSRFMYLCRKMEKNPLATIDVLEYLFGEQKTEELVDKYEDPLELESFLLGLITTKK